MKSYPQILVACIFLISYMHVVAQPSGWEWDYLRKLERQRTPSGIDFNKFITNAADPVALAIPAAFFIKGLATKNQLDKKRSLCLAESFIANVTLTHFLKKAINRKRPGETDPSFVVLTPAGSRSFPSGHTSEAFSMATSLSLEIPKWYVIAPAYTFASLVGYSRMYLGAHYPGDVIAGALLGTSTAWLTHHLNKKWQQHKKTSGPSN